jgi:predicted Zn-ribbon and HTH transcriptional regulator
MKSYSSKSYKSDNHNNIVAKIKITVDGFSCERCGHKWIPKKKDHPHVCPKCKSAYWDIPRKNKSEKK